MNDRVDRGLDTPELLQNSLAVVSVSDLLRLYGVNKTFCSTIKVPTLRNAGWNSSRITTLCCINQLSI